MPVPNGREQYPVPNTRKLAKLVDHWNPPEPIDDAKPTADPQPMQPVRMPLVADMATASADLLFGDPISLGFEDDATADRFDHIRDRSHLDALLVEAGEYSAALGGVFLRTRWDSETTDVPLVVVHSPQLATGRFIGGHLVEATLFNEVHVDQALRLIHVEHYEPGLIANRLFSAGPGTPTLGVSVNLDSHPATEGLEEDMVTPFDLLGAVYMPNLRPGRGAWGRADAERHTDLLDAINETVGSWMRDIRLGRARIVVPREMLDYRGRGQGAVFDLDRAIFTAVDASVKDLGGSKSFEFVQPEIRAAEHEATFNMLVERTLIGSGYAPESFGARATGVAETSSSLRLRERRTFRTRARKQTYAADAVRHAVHLLLEIDKWVFGSRATPQEPISVEFGNPATAGTLELAQTAAALANAQAASIRERVALVHPEWDEGQVDDEVTLILTEASQMIL